MKLPDQVQEAADRADALIKEQNKTPEKAEEENVAEEAKVKAEVKPTAKEPEHQEPTVEPVKTEPTEEAWQHKYSVLQGKYNAEIKPLQDDVKLLSSLKVQVRNLHQRVQEGDVVVQDLKAKLKQEETPVTAQAKVEVPNNVLSLLSDEDKEHFESEGIDNKSIEIIGRLIKDLTSKIQVPQPNSLDFNEIREEVREIKANRVDTFWKEINKDVSDWDVINQSNEFNDWLNDIIPYTSMTRRDALKSAQDQLDYSKVIQMFNDFKKTQTAKLPEPKKESLVDPEKLIEPGSTVGSHEVDTKPTGKTYTRAEVKQLYRDAALGKIPKEEFDRIDRDIVNANREGRITN